MLRDTQKVCGAKLADAANGNGQNEGRRGASCVQYESNFIDGTRIYWCDGGRTFGAELVRFPNMWGTTVYPLLQYIGWGRENVEIAVLGWADGPRAGLTTWFRAVVVAYKENIICATIQTLPAAFLPSPRKAILHTLYSMYICLALSLPEAI